MAATMFRMMTVVASLISVTNADSQFGTVPDTCLADHTKNEPSIDTEDYEGCKSWENQLSCCTVEQGRHLQENGTTPIRYMAPLCGDFSAECRKYLVAIGCFYHCEPMLKLYQHETRLNAPYHVPICGRYCDDWFNACKNDMTCFADWQQGTLLNPGSQACPADRSSCTTFAETYVDGKGLCETMHGFNYKYEASNKNCMVMMFDGDNPNIEGDPYSSANKLAYPLVMYLLGLWLLYNYL